LERYELELPDLFDGLEKVISRVVETHLGAETAQKFDRVESEINEELESLRERLHEVDPTLAEALDTGKKKINYQLEGLRARFHRAQISRDEAAHRQIERAFAQLYPHKELQERHINITSLFARHGRYVIDWIYDAIELGSSDHQVVYL
jgi:uncharacterized protein YllA (UPF0747 family)